MLAVKNAFRFIKWQWNRLETIPKVLLSAIISIIMAVVTEPFAFVSDAFMVTAIILIAVAFGSLLYSILKDQYAKFKEERQALFDTIKHSDKQNKK